MSSTNTVFSLTYSYVIGVPNGMVLTATSVRCALQGGKLMPVAQQPQVRSAYASSSLVQGALSVKRTQNNRSSGYRRTRYSGRPQTRSISSIMSIVHWVLSGKLLQNSMSSADRHSQVSSRSI